MKEREKKKITWDTWISHCPKCNSTKIERLNLYKGMYRKGNPLGLKNQQKHRCEVCKYEFWVDGDIL